MRFWLLIIAIIISISGKTQNTIQKDKVAHIGAGMLISATSYQLIKERKYQLPAAILSTVLIGTAKEVYDNTKPNNKFDHIDLLATISGSAISIILMERLKVQPKYIIGVSIGTVAVSLNFKISL